MKRLFLSVYMIFLFGLVKAQFPYTQKFTYPAQLPTQVVYDMLSDNKGYIWLATDKGLFRFNGRAFVKIPFDNTSMQSVSYLQQDSEGNIWCMNFYKELFSIKNDTLRNYYFTDKRIVNESVIVNYVATKQHIWLASLENLYQIDKSTGKTIKKIYSPEYLGISSIVKNGEEIVAYGAKGWIFKYPAKKEEWIKTPFKYNDTRMMSSGKFIYGAQIGKMRLPAFIVQNGVLKLTKPFNIPEEVLVFHFASTSESEQWICTQTGAYLWNIETGNARLVFPNQSITDIVKDYQGNYWISTLDNGLFVCPSLNNKLYTINPSAGFDNISKVTTINNDTVVVGSTKGMLTTFNIKSESRLHYKLPLATEIQFITYDSINKNIFTNRGIVNLKSPDPVKVDDYGKSIIIDHKKNLIVASYNRTYVLNNPLGNQPKETPDTTGIPLYSHYMKNNIFRQGLRIPVFRNARSTKILLSKTKKYFWIAYYDDLYRYCFSDSTIVVRKKNNQKLIARTLYETSDYFLLAGTSNEGLYVIEHDKVIKRFHTGNGLKSNNVIGVHERNGKIWVNTDESLQIIDIKSGIITNLLDEYGLGGLTVNDFSLHPDKLLLATTSGLVINDYRGKPVNGIIYFPAIKAISNGLELTMNSSLPADKNNISFYFDAIQYKSPTNLNYRYKLVGLDTSWKALSYNIGTLNFYRLTPGSYDLNIQAYDINGIYESDLKSFPFKVLKPFWQQWWFIILMTCFSIGVAYIFLKFWSKRLMVRQGLKERLFKSQLVAIRSQMNPHFIYNVLNTVQGLLYDNRKTEVGNLLGNFSDLMRKTLQASDKQLQSLREEIENITLYLELEKARFDKDFEYTLEVKLQDDSSDLIIPSMLLQPFVENAVKHGLMHKAGKKELSIKFIQSEYGLNIYVEDNGIGRKQSMQINQRNKNKPQSFATKAISERIELFNRLYKLKITHDVVDRYDELNNSMGTAIHLFIPNYDKEQINL
ncbi:MAG TPA: histidine kinase [Sediminibacterium sp.]|uniref:sensor histidine kinase n=1 Tax=Sediminibacterium sp. TaxID=1917865 RepID=UPI000BDD79FC|nr:histidine kinase [Sediminibacterium sp.]OZA63464.1 MAG: hypothetical protein B7X68_10565 [Sphingobacteriia bacterium 39-36-14]HQS24862.1 histidine kinase [Sediminibacterium sp.]HQS36089.1 histidine kinase [Sediminibacterium sp.]